MATDDFSLEPLLNQSSQGDGSARRLAFVPIDTAGVATDRTALSITATAQQVTITVGKRTMEIQNTGTSSIYYGGSGVTSSNGIQFFPNQSKIFANVQDTFSIYFVCAASESSTLRIVEYS